jgi:FkbM family methyltransferase
MSAFLAVKQFFVRNFPAVGRIKRWCKAALHAYTPIKSQYAQHGEDRFVAELLHAYDLKDGVYVDVGANHPSDISNSYLFYRQGLSGVVIEPNRELCALFYRFRSRDSILQVGAGEAAALLKLGISKTPVLSSFVQNALETNAIWRYEFVPVLPLDMALAAAEQRWIYFLSIDVEGLDLQVLRGASTTLTRTLIVSVEFDITSEAAIRELMQAADFELISVLSCNLIYRNRRTEAFARYLRG